MKVLITNGEQRSALAVVRSLGCRGIKTIVVSEYSKNISACSKYCYRAYQCRPLKTDENGFLKDIKNIIQKEHLQYILPITDLSMYLLLDPANGVPYELIRQLPNFELFSFASDKYQLLKLCKDLKISIPTTYFLDDFSQLEYYRDKLRFPIVIKPGQSIRKIKNKWFAGRVKIANDYEELTRICYQDIIYHFPFLLQEKVKGYGYGVFTIFKDGQAVAYFGHKRLREKPPTGGVSVLCESVELNHELLTVAEKILTVIQWNGPVMIEFKFNKQSRQYYVMEINGRFWGSLQLAIDAGVDFPWLLFNPHISSKSRIDYKTGTKLRWLLGDLDHHLALTKTELRSFHKLKHIFRFFTYKENNVRLEVLCKNDMRPFLCEIFLYIKDIQLALNRKIRNQFLNLLMDYFLKLKLRIDPKKKFILKKLPSQLNKILFICNGNLYRSPFAENYLQKIIDSRFSISSAGLNTTTNLSLPYNVIQTAKQFDINLANHRVREFSNFKDKHFDLIIVMERNQKKQLKQFCRKIVELGLFGNRNNISYNIPDPYGMSNEFLYQTYKNIVYYLDNLKKIIQRASA